jgi:hypothetical protein
VERAAGAMAPWKILVARCAAIRAARAGGQRGRPGLLEVYHEATGLPAYPVAIGGGTYSRTMPQTVAFGIGFPGDPETCHMPDEYVDIDKYMLAVKIMARAIARLAGRRSGREGRRRPPAKGLRPLDSAQREETLEASGDPCAQAAEIAWKRRRGLSAD